MAADVTVLPLTSLQPNPFQPREKIKREELEDLIQSIKSYGILEPLVIAQTPAGYQIIAGERRWRAAKEAGLVEVPVIVRKTTPKGMLEMALVENVQRTDLSPIERAQAFQQLIRDFGFNTGTLAEKIGKSAPFVSNSLKLLQLPDAIKDGLLGNLITEGHARALSGLDEERLMVECYKIILKENASVRRAEELVRRFKEETQAHPSNRGRAIPVDDQTVKQWQAQFQHIFNTKSELKLTRTHRRTKISFILNGSPEQTQADLEKILSLAQVSTD